MSKYDEKKDKIIKAFDAGELRVAIRQYDKGTMKVSIERPYVKQGETFWTKAGRLTKEEYEDVTAPKLREKVIKALKDA